MDTRINNLSPRVFVAFFLILAALLTGCKDAPSPPEVMGKSTKKITEFTFRSDDNENIQTDLKGTISGSTVTIILPRGLSATSIPTIQHTGAKISPASGLAQNFANPVTYTVTAEDGSTEIYTVTIMMEQETPESVKINSFNLEIAENSYTTLQADEETIVGVIDQDQGTITIEKNPYIYDFDKSALVATFSTSSAADVSVGGVAQTSGVAANDFTSPVTYTVTANGSSKIYEVTIAETDAAIIPDVNFRTYLREQGALADAFDENEKLFVTHDQVKALAQMVVSTSGIMSLKGIEFFTNLSGLNCTDNSLTTLDVSKNNDLTTLRCADNMIDNLNIVKDNSLSILDCKGNLLTVLDISTYTALTFINCNDNMIKKLDVRNSVSLTSLFCNNNILDSLDLSKNTALTSLFCRGNQLVFLDIIAIQNINRASNRGILISAGAPNPTTGSITNDIKTLKINELLRDENAIKNAKIAVPMLTISTYDNARNLVCADYDPTARPVGTCMDPPNMGMETSNL